MNLADHPQVGQNPGPHPHVALRMTDGGQLEARTRPDRRQILLRRLHADGTQAWCLAIPGDEDAVALARGRERLYTAVYPSGSAGCRVVAVAEADGALLWERQIQGPLPSLHSKYANRIEITATDDEVVVTGRESAGVYREVLDAATGNTRSRRVTAP